jgi:protein required for attachment to host cells
MTTWILLAQRGGACLLERNGDGEAPRVIERIEHPEGRQKDGELVTDRPGRAFDSGGPGRSRYETEETPHDHVAAVFARELAERIERGRIDGRYDELVLAAEPRFLGKLRAALSPAASKLVVASFPTSIAQLADHEIVERVETVLAAS